MLQIATLLCRPFSLWPVALIVACAALASGCAVPQMAPAPGPATPAPRTRNIPVDHTKEKKGAMHKPGLKKPGGTCTSCHGNDLRGSGTSPSCYTCHDQEWH